MWVHSLAVAGVVLGCAAWGLLQMWVAKRDPDCKLRGGCCGGKNCKK